MKEFFPNPAILVLLVLVELGFLRLVYTVARRNKVRKFLAMAEQIRQEPNFNRYDESWLSDVFDVAMSSRAPSLLDAPFFFTESYSIFSETLCRGVREYRSAADKKLEGRSVTRTTKRYHIDPRNGNYWGDERRAKLQIEARVIAIDTAPEVAIILGLCGVPGLILATLTAPFIIGLSKMKGSAFKYIWSDWFMIITDMLADRRRIR